MDEIKNTLKTMSRAMGIKKYREDEPEPVLNCSEPQQVTKYTLYLSHEQHIRDQLQPTTDKQICS